MTTEKQLARIGQIITNAIEQQGISLYSLSAKSGVRYSQIKKIQRGESCRVLTLVKLEAVLKSGVFTEIIFAD